MNQETKNNLRMVKILTLADKMNWPVKVAEIVHDKNQKNNEIYG